MQTILQAPQALQSPQTVPSVSGPREQLRMPQHNKHAKSAIMIKRGLKRMDLETCPGQIRDYFP